MKLPEDMDIPTTRRDTSKVQNRLWLLRNLRIRNGNHPEFNRVITELKQRQRQR